MIIIGTQHTHQYAFRTKMVISPSLIIVNFIIGDMEETTQEKKPKNKPKAKVLLLWKGGKSLLEKPIKIAASLYNFFRPSFAVSKTNA